MNLKLIIFITVTCLAHTCMCQANNNGKTCIPIKDCKHVLKILEKKPLAREDRDYLISLKCGVSGKHPKVLCPNAESQDDSLFNEENCGLSFGPKRIIGGGVNALQREFPWMAMLEYRNKRNQLTPKCGGTLIHPKYVLTAGHCLLIPKSVGVLESVLFGEHETNVDSGDEQRVKVEKFTVHPSYAQSAQEGKHHNDIGLVKLEKPVAYTESIRPICIPLENFDLGPSMLYTVAGWGLTEKGAVSSILQKLDLPLFESENCTVVLGYDISDTQICAGGEAGKDSCKGDSGGPLMVEVYPSGKVTQVGIVSLSVGRGCGVGRPNIYTDLRKYVAWITEIVTSEENH